jgi:hypothetical protein
MDKWERLVKKLLTPKPKPKNFSWLMEDPNSIFKNYLTVG